MKLIIKHANQKPTIKSVNLILVLVAFCHFVLCGLIFVSVIFYYIAIYRITFILTSWDQNSCMACILFSLFGLIWANWHLISVQTKNYLFTWCSFWEKLYDVQKLYAIFYMYFVPEHSSIFGWVQIKSRNNNCAPLSNKNVYCIYCSFNFLNKIKIESVTC